MMLTKHGGYVDYDDEPQEDDAFISDSRGGYSVSFAGKFLGEYDSERRAEAVVYLEMLRGQFWPNVWTVNDHGNTSLCYFDSHVLRMV